MTKRLPPDQLKQRQPPKRTHPWRGWHDTKPKGYKHGEKIDKIIPQHARMGVYK